MYEKLSTFHIAVLIYMVQSGTILFSLPSILAQYFGTNGWIVILPLSLAVILNLWLISLCYKLGDGRSFFVILETSITKYIYIPFYFGLAIIFALIAGLVGKQYVLLFKMVAFQSTSPVIFHTLVCVLSFYLLSKGIYNITKASTLFFMMTAWMVLLVGFHLKELEITRYTPFLLKEGEDWWEGIMQSYAAFLGFEVLLFLFPFVHNRSDLLKGAIYGNLLTTIIYLAIIVISFGFYSFHQLTNLLYPLIDLLAFIKLPFIERLESLLITLFLLKILVTTVIYYWMAQECLKRVFKRTHENLLGFIIILLTYFITLIPKILTEINEWLIPLTYIEYGLVITLPLLILLLISIQSFKTKREQSNV
ncbi:spore germination protein [Bacillus timonensis]|nr:spore germination protein [Bacillus timonensis]